VQRPAVPTLVDLEPGVVASVVEVEPGELRRLAAEGLAPGDRVVVEERLPLGGPIVVRVGRARLALARRVAAAIRVESEPAGR
jgi:Fe2+ transport system protein FeoA